MHILPKGLRDWEFTSLVGGDSVRSGYQLYDLKTVPADWFVRHSIFTHGQWVRRRTIPLEGRLQQTCTESWTSNLAHEDLDMIEHFLNVPGFFEAIDAIETCRRNDTPLVAPPLHDAHLQQLLAEAARC